MADSSPKSSLRRAWRIPVFVLLLLVAGLFALNLIVNYIGRVPNELRAEPAIIASLQNQPAKTPLPLPPLKTPERHPGRAQLAVETMRKNAWDAEFNKLFGPYRLMAYAGSRNKLMDFGPDEQKWLASNAALIESLQALIAECAANPGLIRESITETDPSADLSAHSIPGRDSRISAICQMLCVDAKYQLDLNNPAKARASFMSALALMDFGIRDNTFSRYALMMRVEASVYPVVYVILVNRSPASEWPGLPAALERLDAEIFDRDAFERELINEFREQRARLVWQLDGSWAQPIFGYLEPKGGLLKKISVDIVQDYYLAHYVFDSMKSKMRSAELLKEFDAEKEQVIKEFRMPFNPNTLYRGGTGLRRFLPNLAAEDSIGYFRMGECYMHLARAGLLWRDDRPKAEALRKQELSAHNPWRDPLTSGAFAIEETIALTKLQSKGYEPSCRVFIPQ